MFPWCRILYCSVSLISRMDSPPISFHVNLPNRSLVTHSPRLMLIAHKACLKRNRSHCMRLHRSTFNRDNSLTAIHKVYRKVKGSLNITVPGKCLRLYVTILHIPIQLFQPFRFPSFNRHPYLWLISCSPSNTVSGTNATRSVFPPLSTINNWGPFPYPQRPTVTSK